MPRSGRMPSSAMAAKSVFRALAAVMLLAAPAAGRNYFPDLHFSGACTARRNLNGLRFQHQGGTASGAPWYKASTADEYLYWDTDCGGGGDGQPRWIVTNKVPNPLALRDLDGDGLCNYHARVNSVSHSYPPNTDFWYMDCGGEIRKLLIILGDITTTSTSTTLTTTSITKTTSTTTTSKTSTTRTTTSRTTTTRSTTSTSRTTTSRTTTTRSTTETSTTSTVTSITETISTTRTTTSRTTTSRSTTTTTTTLMVLKLTGACPYKYFLNDLTFVEQGYSAAGARYFKSVEGEQWLYYDEDCNGGGDGAKRWIIDNTMPFPEFKQDLDQDGKCNYHARLDSLDVKGPPRVATWQMYCGIGWVDAALNLNPAANYTFYDGLDESTELKVRGIFAECPQKAFLDSMNFFFQGYTASGAPYYKSTDLDQYIYYDPHCSGNPEGSPRWVLDSDRPDVYAASDLDRAQTCSYHARVKSQNARMPPKGAVWRVECGAEWKDIWLAVIRLPTTTQVTTALPRKGASNSAAGSTPILAVLLLGSLVHLRGRP